MPIRLSVLYVLGAMLLAVPPLAADEEGRTTSLRSRSIQRGQGASEERVSRAWRNPETSFEINRRLSPGGSTLERGRNDGVSRRQFQPLEHDRPELTGRRDVVRVWTRDTGREVDGRGHDRDAYRRDRHDDRRTDRRSYQVVQREHGPISPSEWQAHRQAQIDARRGDTSPRTIDRSRTPDYRDRRDRPFVPFGRDYDTNQPESYEFRSRSPIGPAEIGRGYVIQYDTRAHVHHKDCGHYFYEDRWHQFPHDHVHHEGCGHYFYNNRWNRWPYGHTHYSGCGHYYYDHDWWDFPRSHKHGPHCGHYFYDGIWHRFERTHVHGPDCGHYYYDHTWHFWPRNHRHYPGCGHYYFNSFWYLYPPSYYGYQESIGYYGGDVEYESPLVERYADGPGEHAERAYEKCRRGDYYGAIAAFSTAIAMAKDNGPLYLAQGLAYMKVGDTRSAYTKIMEGLRRTPDLTTGHPDLRGIIPDPEAIEWKVDELGWMLESNPDNDRVLMILGYVHFLMGDYENAKLALQDVAAIDPGNDQARRLLEFIYAREADPGS